MAEVKEAEKKEARADKSEGNVHAAEWLLGFAMPTRVRLVGRSARSRRRDGRRHRAG